MDGATQEGGGDSAQSMTYMLKGCVQYILSWKHTQDLSAGSKVHIQKWRRANIGDMSIRTKCTHSLYVPTHVVCDAHTHT